MQNLIFIAIIALPIYGCYKLFLSEDNIFFADCDKNTRYEECYNHKSKEWVTVRDNQ